MRVLALLGYKVCSRYNDNYLRVITDLKLCVGRLYMSNSVSRPKMQNFPWEDTKRILKFPVVYFNQSLIEVFVSSPGPPRGFLRRPGKNFFRGPSATADWHRTERLIISCRLTGAWSGRVTLYNRQTIILQRVKKHKVFGSWAPFRSAVPGNLYQLLTLALH